MLAALAMPALVEAAPSQRVYLDEDDRLRSVADDSGNRIPDYSHAGYLGGGVPLPDVPAVKTVGPVAGDNRAHLQAALDEIAAMPPGADGFRGALQLEPGHYEVSDTVRVNADGIVLRGAGRASDVATNTHIVRTATGTGPVIVLGGGTADRWREELPDSRSDVISDFVQVGSKAFEIADPDKYEVGDNIIVYHPCTDAWLAAVDYGATSTEPPWPVGSRPLVFNRVITRKSGNMIHLDAPIYNDLDRALSQSYIYKLDRTGIVSHVGIEDLRVRIDNDDVTHAVGFIQVENGWAQGVAVYDFLLGGIYMSTAKHLTVRDVRALDPKGPTIGGRKYNFMTNPAQLVLVEDSYARGGRHSFASNGTSWDSGVVFLRGTADASVSPSEGHHRWAMALLYDNHLEVNVVYSGVLLGLYNRGHYGTGHGWSAAHSVAWNADMAGGKLVVQRPPTAQNYAIGCKGQVNGDGPFSHPTGYIESTGQHVDLPSLYEAQLADRLAHPWDDGEPPEGFEHVVVSPEADTYVRAGTYATENYGDAELLVVKAGNPDFTREVYLRFGVGDVDDFERVVLRLRQPGLGFGGMRYGIAMQSQPWDEHTLTFDNRPEPAEAFAHWFPEQADDSLLDVTAQVHEVLAAGGDALSFRIWATDYYGGRPMASFGSREGEPALQPALVYTVPAPEVPPDDDDGGGTGGSDAGDDAEDTDGPHGDSGEDTETGGSQPDASGEDAGCGCSHRGGPAAPRWLGLALGLGLLLTPRRRVSCSGLPR
jgi:MYXO-CTERM domain-containing protein